MDTRIPHFDGQKDFQVYIRFLDNRKEFEAYDKQLSTKIAAFVKATKLYGKAKNIENLHHDAELLAQRAQSAFGEREGKLKTGEETLARETTASRAELAEFKREAEESQRQGVKKMRDTAAALKAREAEVGKRENAIMARENRAQEAQEAAQKATQEADAMVARMKAATVAPTDSKVLAG